MLCIHSHILLYIRAPVVAQVDLENYPHLVTLTICVLHLCLFVSPFVSLFVFSPFVIHLLSPLFDKELPTNDDLGHSQKFSRFWGAYNFFALTLSANLGYFAKFLKVVDLLFDHLELSGASVNRFIYDLD